MLNDCSPILPSNKISLTQKNTRFNELVTIYLPVTFAFIINYIVGILTCYLVICYACRFLSGVRYVSFDTDVSMLCKRLPRCCYNAFPLFFILNFQLLVWENEWSILFPLIVLEFSSQISLWICQCVRLSCLFRRKIPHFNNKIQVILLIFNVTMEPPKIFCENVLLNPIGIILHSCNYDFPTWVSVLVIILSNDIGLNPGDFLREGFLSFCNWNINSLSKEIFQRPSLLEAHNSLLNYDTDYSRDIL